RCSARPRPYCGAVSTKLMPDWTAAVTVSRACWSGTSAKMPAMLALPNPSSVTRTPVLPTCRVLKPAIIVLRRKRADTDMLVAPTQRVPAHHFVADEQVIRGRGLVPDRGARPNAPA